MTTTTVTLSTRLLNTLKSNKVKPSQFKRLLLSKKSTFAVSFSTGVSERTVQEYRKTIREAGRNTQNYNFNTL